MKETEHGAIFEPGEKPVRQARRNARLLVRHESGMGYAKIAKEEGMSASRVREIIPAERRRRAREAATGDAPEEHRRGRLAGGSEFGTRMDTHVAWQKETPNRVRSS